MYFLTPEDILYAHYRLIKDFGGSHGVRDEKRLSSVIATPRQQAFGAEQYPGVFEKAAVYARNITGDHPFVDGNKRCGISCASVFLMKNGHVLVANPKELEDFAVKIAVDRLGVSEIAKWLETHSRKN